MVAPIDAKASFEVEGDEFTIRMNFRTLSLAKRDAGVDLLSGDNPDWDQAPALLRALAIQEHPDLDDEEAFAVIAIGMDDFQKALEQASGQFGERVGNVQKKAKAKARA